MKLLTVLAATAVAAAIAAALSIPAGADPSAGDATAKIATCLRAHGAADAPSGTDARALKQWLATHADNPAVGTCNPGSRAPAALASCLRAHGLNPSANLFLLKPWMTRLAVTEAGKATLHACGVDFDQHAREPSAKAITACLRAHGANVPAGTDGVALKHWVRDHASDAQVMDLMKRCARG